MDRVDLEARAARVMSRCEALAAFTEESGCITRPYGTSALSAAQSAIGDWMEAAGLKVHADAIGNLRGRYEGSVAGASAMLLGSHFDSVRDAGKYDGTLGILVAVAAIERLSASGQRLPFPVEVIAFPDEEGLRFQTTYLGSSALAGTFEPALLDRTDADGITMREAIATFGGDPAAIDQAALREDEAFAYVEVHIEQGPYLESVDAPLGVVTAISGQSRLLAAFTGTAGHAGTVAMALRRDPLPAAAELILAAESLARERPGLLATVGMLAVLPGASNVIPGRVELSLDIRHPEDDARRAAVHALEPRARQIAVRRGLDVVEWSVVRDHPAVPCDPRLSARLQSAVQAAGRPVHVLPSGAGHDAAVMSSRLPVAMLFVRCAGGISHNPAESVDVLDVEAAIAAIDHLINNLAEGAAHETAPAFPTIAGSTRHYATVVRGASVVSSGSMEVLDVAINDGVIADIAPRIAGTGREEIAAEGLYLFPGAVDIHVHFNEPGRANWEGWTTGSAAAACGGTTTVAEMPLNARPPTLDGASFDAKRAAAEAGSLVDFALWGGLTPINLDRMAELAERGVIGFKAFMSNSGIDDFPRADDATLREGMQRAVSLGLPVAVHAEDESMTAALAAKARAENRISYTDYAASRPPEAEIDAIGRAIRYAEESGCALHVVHVSTAAALAAIGEARDRGVDVTAETCPHYFTFSEDDLPRLGALMKCAPPLRSHDESSRLLQAVAGGHAQIVASDHSPCPPSMKNGDDVFAIWGGIAGCQSLLPATISAIHNTGGAPLPFAVKLISEAPARRLRLHGKGQISPGFDADLVLVDMGSRYTLDPWRIRYRHQNSPYVNCTFPLKVNRVLLRGQTIVLDDELKGSPRGRLAAPSDRAAT